MATKIEKLEKYTEELKKIESNSDLTKLEEIIELLGPSIFNKDSETVSCSDKAELERVKTSNVVKKLGLNPTDSDLEKVCEKMGKSNRNKYRAIFYYLLTK